MAAPRWWNSYGCRVAHGADAAMDARSGDPFAPVIALIDATAPEEAILAQAAGADIVLPIDAAVGHRQIPELELAARTAITIAQRRRELASSSRRACHDVAEALNVIGLAADAAQGGQIDHDEALDQIRTIVHEAGDDAWRAGRTHRSASLIPGLVALHEIVGLVEASEQLTVEQPAQDLFVLADRRWLIVSLRELVANARRAGASQVSIRVRVRPANDSIEIIVVDNGCGFRPELEPLEQPFLTSVDSDRLGLGLASLAEQAAELGGGLELRDSGRGGALTQVAITLVRLDDTSSAPAANSTELGVASAARVEPPAAEANILEGVVRHAPLAESLEGIVSAIEGQLPGTMCSVLLLHGGARLQHGAGARLPLAYREAIDGVAIGLGQGSCGTAAHTGRPVVASDVTTDHNWTDFRSIATKHGLRSCWSTPIVAAEGAETLGTFAVYTSKVWSPDPAAMRLVNRYTYLAAVAIEHHRLFGELAESEARFRSAFEGTTSGIALASLDGVVLKSNPALFEIVGEATHRLPGACLLDLIDPAFHSLVTESWAGLANEGAAGLGTVEVPLVTQTGEGQVWLSLHTSLIAGEFGRQPYLYIEVRDVTATRHQIADLRAREAAEAENRAKTDFLALASHELRTPLNAILGFAQVMQLLEVDEGQRADSVDHIVNAGRHLRDLIDELLDLSRIEAGQLSVKTRRISVGTVIDDAIEIVSPLAAARGIDLIAPDGPTTSPVVLTDPQCLRQVLINLLDNAIKYTPHSGRIGVVTDATSDATVRVTVNDSGTGISPDSLDAIFQPFHRLDPVNGDASKGTGLGLALCARLMEELDGSIGVASTLGAGSSFWIDLPTAATATTEPVDYQIDLGGTC